MSRRRVGASRQYLGIISKTNGLDLTHARIGVLGGSGLYAMEGLEDVQEIEVDTPYGKPSDSLRLGKLEGMQVVFLARHGRHHAFLPTEVPYRANIWALRSLGVRWILSASAVGSLQQEVSPRDMVDYYRFRSLFSFPLSPFIIIVLIR